MFGHLFWKMLCALTYMVRSISPYWFLWIMFLTWFQLDCVGERERFWWHFKNQMAFWDIEKNIDGIHFQFLSPQSKANMYPSHISLKQELLESVHFSHARNESSWTKRFRWKHSQWDKWQRKVKQMQPVRFYIFSSKQFEETFENPQWRKIKQMQPVWIYILSSKPFEDTF